MSVEPTPGEAANLLATADGMRNRVEHHAARESRAFIGWAVFCLVMLPPFGFISASIWGPIICVAGFGGGVLTMQYFRRHARSVRLSTGAWSLIWIPWGLWYGGWNAAAGLLPSKVDLIGVWAALAPALPLLLVGVHLPRQGR